MNTQEKNTPVGKEQPQESGKDIKPGANSDADEFQRKTGLDGKTDSGPEPEVHGRKP